MAEDKNAQEASVPGNTSGVKPMLFFALLAVNMVAIVAIGFMVYTKSKQEAAKPTIDTVIQGEHDAQTEEHAKETQFVGKLIPLETFLVNLAGSRGRKILKVNMELEIDGDGIEDEIEKRKAQIRDIIIILLSSKSYEDVAERKGKDFLRDEIRDTVNAFLTKGRILKVYFTEFIYN